MTKSKILFILSILILSQIIHSSSAFEDSAYGPLIQKEGYSISRSQIIREIAQGNLIRESIEIQNNLPKAVTVSFSATDEVQQVIDFESTGLTISPSEKESMEITVIGKERGIYTGAIILSGDIDESIFVNITVTNISLSPELLLAAQITQKEVAFNKPLEITVDVNRVLIKDTPNVTFNYTLKDLSTNVSYPLGSELRDIFGSFQLRKEFPLPKDLKEGYYVVEVSMDESKVKTNALVEIHIYHPFLTKKVFGFLPVWILLIIISLIILGIASYIIAKRVIEAKKKYKMALHLETLPKKDTNMLYFGKVAETEIPAYYDMNLLCTHGVVAGATGGGKSISAQVIVEEALMKNVAVIVFDPTAQWSGMLRKCEDKKMFAIYPRFGMKPSDSRAFPGNVRMIKNAREAIDIKKYIRPGQIQIFACNKLDPSEMDNIVASAIVSIFRSGPEEYPGLRVLIVFDEVHRLLPKFGGSGRGFLQIERSCREFRKWGFGVLLVSQVLSDFVGEIKANINTEAQMRTRDESDLNRIKTKYGETFLQSLIKASVGTGMFVNPKYNRGKPYFISFRPILHNTRRLSDEVLEKYNGYNEVVDDLEYQIDQLEAEKVDVFDLKMELKLVKDKLMSGNFTVVDIYLEGLKPRIEKQWQSLGKQPKKKELELIAEQDISASLAAAQKERDKWKLAEQAAPQAEVKKEDIKKKLLKSLTLDNGMMISSFQELVDLLPSLAADIYSIHVNPKKSKNDFADWITKEFDPSLGAQLKKSNSKEEMVQTLKNFKPSTESPAPAQNSSPPAQETKEPSTKKELPDPLNNSNAPQEQPSKKELPDTQNNSGETKEASSKIESIKTPKEPSKTEVKKEQKTQKSKKEPKSKSSPNKKTPSKKSKKSKNL